jgi:16S rRNA (cytosine967-C5)-methyltransferase
MTRARIRTLRPSPVRRIALELLGLAETSRHPLSDLLERKSLELEAAGAGRDVSFLRHLVLGTLRRRLTLDALIGAVSRRPLESLDPRIRNLLRLGAFQLSSESRIPPHAAVHESVRLAKRLGHAGIAGFVNAVLRGLVRRGSELLAGLQLTPDPLHRLSLLSSHPLWLIERWASRFGLEAARARCEQNNLEAPVDLRVNLGRLEAADAIEVLRKREIRAAPLDTQGGLRLQDASDLPRVLALTSAGAAMFYVQSRLSQVAAESAAQLAHRVLERRPGGGFGAIALDACAAPGGKCLVLSQLLPRGVRLLAHDSNPRRLSRLRGNLTTLGVDRVEVLAPAAGGADPLSELQGRCAIILLDAPCTALGVIRRHPEIRWRRRPGDPARLGALQLDLVRRLARLLEPGGALLYSVCSFEPEETNEVLTAALADGTLRSTQVPGASCYSGLQADTLGLMCVGAESGEDGYYMAALERTAEV